MRKGGLPLMSTDRITHLSPVTVLPGVGKVRADAYARLEIQTLGDLLLHYPRAYEDRSNVYLLKETPTDKKCSVLLTVGTEPKCVRLRSHKSFLKFRAFDESGSCEITYFNQDYLKSQFSLGSVFRFYGKVERQGNRCSMAAPVAEASCEGIDLPPLHAIYRLTEGLSQKQIAKDVGSALALLANERDDPIPLQLRKKHGLCTLAYAERNIHDPTSVEALSIARKRLVYEEFFLFSLATVRAKKMMQTHSAPSCPQDDLSPLLSLLPYRLTGAQMRAVTDICKDMKKHTPMSRILVGDVGSGKTVCAVAAMYLAIKNGRQAVLMAPTEILARQHYNEISPLFEKLGISCALLIGATPAAEKRRIKAALTASDTECLQAVIGTHALLSDDVALSVPGLVVTDEQHRFGAKQRAKLSAKSLHAHQLVMSATPIPRSLALVLYGDLDISRIDEMPPGRQPVDTFVIDESYRERLLGFIRKQTDFGKQVYIVCPAIEETEESSGGTELSEVLGLREKEETAPLKAAIHYTADLQKKLPDVPIAFLHGKMKSAEKERIMHAFVLGEIKVLVSTTVIEVGVNVPNATLMIVENAERFGLSQLHQLRGRVGRGTERSYCILVNGEGADSGQTARARLQTMHTTHDGYAIAEQDLQQRGPGDFLATSQDGTVRQSGGLRFRLADVGADILLMNAAAEDARTLLTNDPTLTEYPLLLEHTDALFSMDIGLIS